MKTIYMILWRAIAYPALAYGVLSFVFFYLYVHPRRYISHLRPSNPGHEFETISFFTSDGVRLAGWFIPNKNSKKAVIVCHGYPMDKGNVYGMTSFLAKDFNLMLFDFRAMGRSGGFFSTGGPGETTDVNAAISFLEEKGFTDIGLFGFSMGAATILMSQNPAVKARVADAPFADITGELNYILKGYGVFRHPLIRLMKAWSFIILGIDMDRVSPLHRVTDIKTPVLIIHGDKDAQVPVESAFRLKAANPGVELWIIKGAGHGETRAAAGEAYESKVIEFFRKNL